MTPEIYPKPKYAWFVTFILLFAYAVSYVDRQILSLMVEPIKADLQITDTQVSLLHGFAFAIFYTFLGLILGRWADRKNRRNLIIAGILIWSVATAAGGVAVGFFSLFLARVFVGVGEASLSPSAYSMLSDYFPPQKRAKAMSLYSLGVYLGSALAFIVGGLVIEATKTGGTWKTAFFIVAIPGFVAALLMLLVKEPERKNEIVVEDHAANFSYVKTRKTLYAPLILGYSTISIVTLGLMAWVPATFIRKWNYTPKEIGLSYGAVILVFGLLGMWVSGWVSDFWHARGKKEAAFSVSLMGSVLLIPGVIAFGMSSSPELALASLAFITFFLGFPIALAPAVYQSVTPNSLRGQVIAIYLFANNVIGMSAGPTAVAALTDRYFKDPLQVGTSLSLVCFGASVVGVLLLGLARKPYLRVLTSVAR